jgi:hypothetical protein
MNSDPFNISEIAGVKVKESDELRTTGRSSKIVYDNSAD